MPEVPATTYEVDELEKYALMASLVVYKGQSMAAAYRAVYDAPEGTQCPAKLATNSRFRGMITRLRASAGMTDEEVKGAVESLYLQAVVDEGQSMKVRLQAAQQWQKLRGLEKQKEVVQEDEDMAFFKACMKKARESQKNVIDIQAE